MRQHYKTMSVDDICALPVVDLAADDCVLFCWVTFPNLKEGLRVIEAWGFRYVTIGFTWVKLNESSGTPVFGIGYYTKSNAEICLIGVRGKPSNLKASNRVSSVILSKIREHSRKPDEARVRIEELFGDVPKIELFARERFAGWDVWGNEAPAEVQKVLQPKRKNRSE